MVTVAPPSGSPDRSGPCHCAALLEASGFCWRIFLLFYFFCFVLHHTQLCSGILLTLLTGNSCWCSGTKWGSGNERGVRLVQGKQAPHSLDCLSSLCSWLWTLPGHGWAHHVVLY